VPELERFSKTGEQHTPESLPRRRVLLDAASGLGGVALAWLLAREGRADAMPPAGAPSASPYAPKAPHFPSRARRVVQVFAAGGVSHIDTFDYKPALERHDGQDLAQKDLKEKPDPFFGQIGKLRRSPFRFTQHGQGGLWFSDLFPALSGCADEIAMIHSMVSRSNNHTPATFLLNSGFTMNGFPSLGAWLSYGLGSENEDLPAFVVLPDPRGLPAGGAINWTAGFLPAVHQGVALRAGTEPIPHLATPPEVGAARRKASLEYLERLNRRRGEREPGDALLEARIRAYELAARMQASVPEAVDVEQEDAETKALYGLDSAATKDFARNCLLARRLLERGVRFVQLFHGGAFGSPRINWDAHEDIVENHTQQAASLDRPLAGLIQDLKRRGLLEDTLVVFSTEFGRTPYTQGTGGKGRDHHQLAFTCWLAGGGVRGGIRYGASDELGYAAAERPATTYDLHATILHLLGLDHEELTYYHNGARRRLTDVHGRVLKGLLV
jgi:hypothetical protein